MTTVSTTQIRGWVERCRQGDVKARDELLTHTQARLAAIARRRLRGPFAILEHLQETGDVVQDLYVKLLQRWDSVIHLSDQEQGDDPARTFFRRSARLICDVLCDSAREQFGRAQDRSPPVSLDALAKEGSSSGARFDPGSSTHDPAQLALWTEFQEFFKSLPDGLQDVAYLHWFHDLSHAEVGEALGIAEITSRTRWAKVRHAFKEHFPDTRFDLGV